MIFASALVLDREPLTWADLPGAVQIWVQNAGAVAALGLAIWVLAQTLQRRRILGAPGVRAAPSSGMLTTVFVLGTLVSIGGYLLVLLMGVGFMLGLGFLGAWLPSGSLRTRTAGDILLTASGALALVLVLTPMLLNLATGLRWGRIWALARLSITEAVRKRVVTVFFAIALVFLFADWFIAYKPEDQLRNYVRVVYWSMSPLFLITAALLGAFSIPADVKSLSIHTIVTKPVEKFEIVLGRFLGFAILLTACQAVVAVLSLGYLLRGVNDEAARESGTARVPIFGQLSFVNTKSASQADSVGREFDYRQYISGPSKSSPDSKRQYAVWTYAELPGGLGARTAPVRFEYTFDIFRLSKGKENEDIPCTFTFVDGAVPPEDVETRLRDIRRERDDRQQAARRDYDRARSRAGTKEAIKEAEETFARRRAEIESELIKEYRVYQRSGVPVTDYHTQVIEVPAAFFAALQADGAAAAPGDDRAAPPALRALVNVDFGAESQMLGVAPRDFYLLAAEGAFWVNFLKGIVGMWCTTLLVLGVAISCSTYLSGVISLLTTLVVLGFGMWTDFLQQVATRRVTGGGVFETVFRLSTRTNPNAQLADSPTTSILRLGDDFFNWWISRIINLLPDVNRHDLHPYVANGFDIAWGQVLFVDNLLPLIGYLLPWFVLAYYLLRYREIANPT